MEHYGTLGVITVTGYRATGPVTQQAGPAEENVQFTKNLPSGGHVSSVLLAWHNLTFFTITEKHNPMRKKHYFYDVSEYRPTVLYMYNYQKNHKLCCKKL